MEEFNNTNPFAENKGEIIDSILNRNIQSLRNAAGKNLKVVVYSTTVGKPGFVCKDTGEYFDKLPELPNTWRVVVRHPAKENITE